MKGPQRGRARPLPRPMPVGAVGVEGFEPPTLSV